MRPIDPQSAVEWDENGNWKKKLGKPGTEPSSDTYGAELELLETEAVGHFRIYYNTVFIPPKFCISIVFNFSKSQQKLETMLM